MRFPLVKAAIEARSHTTGRRLILHAGSPKTGTTAVQVFFDTHREVVSRQGVVYPQEGLGVMRVPKHQWLHHFLHPILDEARFARHLANALDEGDNQTRAILFSTEAIFNHWWDYKQDVKDLLTMFQHYFDLVCIVWLREPSSFFRSYYLQCLLNPSDDRVYGRDLSASDMLDIAWVRQRLRYNDFLNDAERVFGAGRMYAFAYNGNTIAKMAQLLNIDVPPATESVNVSPVSAISVSMLRAVNQVALTAHQKRDVVRLVHEIDAVVGLQSPRFELDLEAVRRVGEISSMSAEILAELDVASTKRWYEQWPNAQRRAEIDEV